MNDIETLKQWFQENHDDLFRFLCKVSGDVAGSRDILQEVYIRAYLKFHLFDPDRGTLKNWLYRVARNLLHDEQRKTAVERKALAGLSHLSVTEQPPHHEVAEDRRPLMKRALFQMPLQKRELLILAARHTIADLAEILALPEGTIKSRIHYCRRELSAILDRIDKENDHGKP